jgi:hypothetical protein
MDVMEICCGGISIVEPLCSTTGICYALGLNIFIGRNNIAK